MPKATTKSPAKAHRKAHYPAAKLNVSEVKNAAVKQRSDHDGRVPLVPILEVICKAEEDSIRSYFQNHGKSLPNREIIESVLTKILQELPAEVQSQGGNSIDFHPELSAEHRSALDQRNRKLQTLEELSNLLTRLEQDPDELRKISGLWLGRAPTASTVVPASEQVGTHAATFEAVLDSMNGECDKILTFAQECQDRVDLSEARQGRLYNAFKSASVMAPSETVATHIVPKDARDLLRALPRFMPK